MKHLLMAIILGAQITAAGQPLMTDTDVPTEGAEDGSEEKTMWDVGASPVWVHGPNDEPVYYILNDDASYYEVDEKTYVDFCKKYCEENDETYFPGYPADHPDETIEAIAGKWATMRSGNNYIAAQLAAREVLSASDIPDEAIFMAPGGYSGIDWDDPMFYYTLPDGSYYKVSPETYMDYAKKGNAVLPADGDNFTSGTGTLIVTANVDDELQDYKIRIGANGRLSEMPTVIDLYPPEYKAELSVSADIYNIDVVKSVDESGVTICKAECSMYNFFIADGATTNLNIDIVPEGGFEKEEEETTFVPEEPTPTEEVQAEPTEESLSYVDADEFMDPGEEYPPASFSADGEETVPVKKSNGIGIWLAIGGVLAAVAVGVTVFIKRKKNDTKD